MFRRSIVRAEAGLNFLQFYRYGSKNAPCFGVVCPNAAGMDSVGRSPSSSVEALRAAAHWADATQAFRGIPPKGAHSKFNEAFARTFDTKQPSKFVSLIPAPEQLRQMELYVKALLIIAGDNRRAQDWLAGWLSTMTGNSDLVTLAFQFEPTDEEAASILDEFIEELEGREGLDESYRQQVLRCFTFDCMTLLSLTQDLDQQSVVHHKVYDFGERIGMSQEFLIEAEAIAREEQQLAKEKFLALDEDDSAANPAKVAGGNATLNSEMAWN